jgi:hypothetical protein
MKSRALSLHLAAAGAVMVLGIWLSSGTMAPYASTFFCPLVTEPCGYLHSVDHPLHEAAFRMLDGQPPERWRASNVLRRLLFPLVAYPFMKLAGFDVGGFIASVLCQLAGLVALALFLRRRHGERAAIAGSWLLAAYPGITYWAALPYAYVAIVPASIGLFVLLTALDDRGGVWRAAWIGAAMGALFVAYDLLPFFGVAALLLLLYRRRFVELPVAAAAFAVAPALTALGLKLAYGVGWTNNNTAIYGTVARAYLHPPALGVWLRAIADFIPLLVTNFFFSNFVFLPWLFLVLAAVARRRLSTAEATLLIAAGLIFAFNNLAPPYEGRWQMRGDFIPRLYQPIFVALLVYCARIIGDAGPLPSVRQRLVLAAAAFALAGNLSIAFGPIARVPWTGVVYHRFYEHSGPDTMDRLLAAHGRRPLGFCRRDDPAVGSSRVPDATGAPVSLEREYGWARSIERCTPPVTGAQPAAP